MNPDQSVVTRFAPSPTGFQHIGGMRTALFAYLFARKHHGTFIVRIEDTDKEREVPGSITHLTECLSWLGLDYDYGPDKPPGPWGSVIQSQRLPLYQQYAQRLIAAGHAYPDPRTPEELEALRIKAAEEKRPFLVRDHRPPTFDISWDGTQPLRLKVPDIKRYTWHDAVRGELSAGPEALDDVILIKADGYPTYNFAHIVDDAEMGVTHIMRADEFIASTPKFLAIYDALELSYPVFVSLPPILREDRTKKLGKRDGAKDVLEYRSDGYLPEAMINFLALTGWNPGTDQELFSRDELIAAFDITKIQRAGAVINEEKLQWMNKYHLGKRGSDFQFSYVEEALRNTTVTTLPNYSRERLLALTPTIIERIHNTPDITAAAEAGEYDWAFATPTYETSLLKWKKDPSVAEAGPRLAELQKRLMPLANWDKSTIEGTVMPYAEEAGKGEVLWPLRVALSGRAQSPDPVTLMIVLGKTASLERLATACAKIAGDVAHP
jgi:glutamyl-tRNA synthetase